MRIALLVVTSGSSVESVTAPLLPQFNSSLHGVQGASQITSCDPTSASLQHTSTFGSLRLRASQQHSPSSGPQSSIPPSHFQFETLALMEQLKQRNLGLEISTNPNRKSFFLKQQQFFVHYLHITISINLFEILSLLIITLHSFLSLPFPQLKYAVYFGFSGGNFIS